LAGKAPGLVARFVQYTTGTFEAFLHGRQRSTVLMARFGLIAY